MNIKKATLFSTLIVMTSAALAEIPVTRLDTTDESRLDRLERIVTARNDVQLLTRLNQMQQEVQMLRGMIEEQTHSIEMLEKRQRALYADLDKRIQKIKTTSSQTGADGLTFVLPDENDGASASLLPSSKLNLSLSEQVSEATMLDTSAYQAAYSFIKDKSYIEAVSAFKSFLSAYPESDLVPNAHYWLGELFLLKREHLEAINSFHRVVSDYAAHPKAADAMVKLGIVNLELGKMLEATQIFNQVKTQFPSSAASRIAEARLSALAQETLIR